MVHRGGQCSPPHHETDSLHVLQIQRLSIRLRLPTVGRLELPERDHQPRGASSRAPITTSTDDKVVLPADGALVPPVRPPGQHLVLERERVPPGVGARDVQHERVVGRDVPPGDAVGGALRGEPRAAQGRDVQVARELGLRGPRRREDGQVGLGLAAADAVVRGGELGRVPGPVCFVVSCVSCLLVWLCRPPGGPFHHQVPFDRHL